MRRCSGVREQQSMIQLVLYRRVTRIARRAIHTWTVAKIASWGVPTLADIAHWTVAVSRLQSCFYVLNL